MKVEDVPLGPPALTAFEINGVRSFLDGADIRERAASGAHGLLVWLSQGYLDASIANADGVSDDGMSLTSARVVSAALDGIAMLVALSAYGAQHAADAQVRAFTSPAN